jgi:SAM-dependent methyltransferase
LTTDVSVDVPTAQEFYGEYYFKGGDYQDYQSSELVLKRNFARFIKRLQRVQPSGKMLELGCALGYFLELAQCNWEVTGIDISESATSQCASHLSGSVLCGDLLATDLPCSHYDWVVAWDTVEHLDRPRDYVARCLELLRPGGHLALTTGDVSSWSARLLGRKWRLFTPPSHLTFFTRKGMVGMLGMVGFNQISLDTVGYDRSLAFTAFRLLGEDIYDTICHRFPKFHHHLGSLSYYVNIRDIMFVTARKPA